MRHSENNDLWRSLILSLASGTLVYLIWMHGTNIVDFLHSFFNSRSFPSEITQFTFLLALSLMIGFFAEKQLIIKYRWFFITGLVVWLLALVVAARVYNYGVLFIPGIGVILLTILSVHIKKLWQIDSNLTEILLEIVASNRNIGGKTADLRLESSLRLLENLLPSSQAVIFEITDNGELNPIGRLKQDRPTDVSAVSRQSSWREGVQLCEQALEAQETIVQTQPDSPQHAKVALPLIHDNIPVGVLLVEIRKDFVRSDRFLLESFSEQIARNFRRREFFETDLSKNWHGFLSSELARTRLELITLYHSFTKEQRFGALASSYLKEAHAIAYLDGTIAFLNRQMQTMAGINFESINDVDLFGLLTRFKSEVFNEPTLAVKRVLQTGENFQCEIDFPEKKQTLDLQITLVKIPREDQSVHNSTVVTKPICFLITIRDITPVKENEKLRSDMVSLMSHELRTPITSIKGFAELLLMDEDISSESREFLDIISNESLRLSKMLTTFLSVSNLEQSDKREMHKTPVKLDKIVSEVAENLKDVAKSKRIRIVEHANTHLPPIAADKGLITRAISNLIDNAIKYSPERTSVIISTILESDFLRVVVEDRGYGIPKGETEKIFQKFYRVEREGHDKEGESTGLGLAFVKEAVEQHGGEISVESEVGHGSKFSITLPRL